MSDINQQLNTINTSFNNIKSAIIEKGQTPSGDITTYAEAISKISGGGGDEWQPDPEWFDIETILKEDTRQYAGKAIILYSNSDDFTELVVSDSVVAVATSDGAFYTSTTTHTWDRSKDKIVSQDEGESGAFGTRYVIIYFNSDDVDYKQLNNFYSGGIYVVFACNINDGSGFDGEPSIFSYNFTMQSFKFFEGYNLNFGTDFFLFCGFCSSLKKIPENLDISSGTSFYCFLLGCSSLKKLPDSLDFSNGTDFSQFCDRCHSLEKLPDNLDVSNGTDFSYFCSYCYSLEKLPDNLDVSNGTNFSGFCYGCSALKQSSDVLDISNSTAIYSGIFYDCPALIKANIKLPSNYSVTLSSSNLLSMESLRFIAENAPNVSGKTLTIGATNIARAGGASGTIIQTLTNKGWTVR